MKFILTFWLVLVPVLGFAQLPYYPQAAESNTSTFIGFDIFSFGLPFSVVLIADMNEKHSIRVGASPFFPDEDLYSSDNQFSTTDITFYLSYARLIKNSVGYVELGGAVLAGPSSTQSNFKQIETPALALLMGIRTDAGKKLSFHVNFTPVFNTKNVNLTGGFGLAYRF
ncbi:hypothetical protein EP331_02985 [bacterium]|nr:MAG: hypothetical protein EP331_02985 [bacterium]